MSSKTLKNKYDGVRRSVRQKRAAIRTDLYQTGGGQSSAEPLVKDMITLSAQGLTNPFDNDTETPDNPDATCGRQVQVTSNNQPSTSSAADSALFLVASAPSTPSPIPEIPAPEADLQQWGNWSSAPLFHTPRHPALMVRLTQPVTERRRHSSAMLGDHLMEERIKFLALQRSLLLKGHEMKVLEHEDRRRVMKLLEENLKNKKLD